MNDEGCTCDDHKDDELHECPFAAEIHDDDSPVCTCCPECTYQCALDI
jgi:hypothetical protein